MHVMKPMKKCSGLELYSNYHSEIHANKCENQRGLGLSHHPIPVFGVLFTRNHATTKSASCVLIYNSAVFRSPSLSFAVAVCFLFSWQRLRRFQVQCRTMLF